MVMEIGDDLLRKLKAAEALTQAASSNTSDENFLAVRSDAANVLAPEDAYAEGIEVSYDGYPTAENDTHLRLLAAAQRAEERLVQLPADASDEARARRQATLDRMQGLLRTYMTEYNISPPDET